MKPKRLEDYLDIAAAVARFSKDQRTKVGAVATQKGATRASCAIKEEGR